MTNTDKLSLCRGCRNDYYNRVGNSENGECWMLQQARPVTMMRVGIWQNPPYRWNPEQTLSCHSPDVSVWIDHDECRVVDPEEEAGAQ